MVLFCVVTFYHGFHFCVVYPHGQLTEGELVMFSYLLIVWFLCVMCCLEACVRVFSVLCVVWRLVLGFSLCYVLSGGLC